MEKLDPGTKLQVGSHEAEIVKYLAQGGFAYIYLVKYSPIEYGQEIAALKRVIVRSKPELNLLRKEVDIMQKLADNKYVVRYFDSNAQKLEDGTYEVLLLMEYCPNKSLLDYMNLHLKTKLRFDQILKIMYQISTGLSSMHYLNLIHRDLKIENVLIDKDENFKLCDFGSTSSFINPPTNQDEFNYILNDIIHQTTPQYRAPEMIDLYKAIPIDNKSDIWALGVFLYKLMYYTTPFESQGDLAILHGYFQFPELPKYPSHLKNLIIIMLQVNPSLRPNIYQVVYEICDMVKKPVPIKDYYGLGPYDFKAYERYQQQLAFHQQQQQEQQLRLQQEQQRKYTEQQQKLQEQQQQKLLEEQKLTEQHREGSLQNTQAERQPLPDDVLRSEKSHSSLLQQAHQLTKSSNASDTDLSTTLNEGSTDDTKLVDKANLELEDEMESREDGNDSIELDNVEERFPDLDDIEKATTNDAVSRSPSRGENIHSEELDGIKNVTSNKSSVSRATSIKSNYKVPNNEIDSTAPFSELNYSNPQTQEEHTTSETPQHFSPALSHEAKFQQITSTSISSQPTIEKAKHPGLKYTKTEAWEVPVEQDSKLDTFDIFHKKEEQIPVEQPHSQPQPQKSQPSSSFNSPLPSTVDPVSQAHSNNHFSFDNNSQPSSKPNPVDTFDELFSSIKSSTVTVSNNPFPTSKNPFPTKIDTQQPLNSGNRNLSIPSSAVGVKPQLSGGNPWGVYTTHTSTSPQSQPFLPQTQAPKPQNYSTSQPVSQIQQQDQRRSTMSPNQQPAFPSHNNNPYLNQFSQQNRISTPALPSQIHPLQQTFQSPTITIEDGEKLIDLDDAIAKKEHKKLDLELVEVKDESERNRKKISTSRKNSQEDDYTDSEGELVVEEMSIPRPSNAGQQSRKSSAELKMEVTKKLKESQGVSQDRKIAFADLNGLKFDLEELDLDDQKSEEVEKQSELENQDDLVGEIKEIRHSRRSLEIPRMNRSKSRSNSNHRSDSHERSHNRGHSHSHSHGLIAQVVSDVEKKKEDVKSKRRSFLGF